MNHRPGQQLALIAIAQLLAMTLWFSATAVLPQLREAWHLSTTSAAWMTAAVQLGFVTGALGSALLSLPDIIPPRRMVWVASVLGASLNLALAWTVSSAGPAIALRFATGLCLAGVYPPGMKIAAGHMPPQNRGFAISVLVGALTLGSATPHLVAGLFGSAQLSHSVLMTISSAFALTGALLVARFVSDGPHGARPAAFDPRQAGRVLRDRAVLLANLGYFGHMWELYAMWTWLALFLTAALGEASRARLAAFAIIGVAGCLLRREPLGIPRAGSTLAHLRSGVGGRRHRRLGPVFGRDQRAVRPLVHGHGADPADEPRLRAHARADLESAVSGSSRWLAIRIPRACSRRRCGSRREGVDEQAGLSEG